MSDVELMLLTGFLGAGLRLGMAIGFAAIGEAVCERSGVINVGIEGIMLVGAFLATIGAVYSGSPWIGVALALVGGAAMAGIHAVLVIKRRARCRRAGHRGNIGKRHAGHRPGRRSPGQ